jgi:integrase
VRNRKLSGIILQAAKGHAVRLKLVAFNPCPDIHKPRPPKHEIRPWTREQAEKMKTTPSLVPMVRFHDLRHTNATMLLLQGIHPKVVSERLGHSRVEITLNTYSHVLPTMQKEAAASLDRLFG